MGLFTPKISPQELEYVRTRMAQAQECAHHINTTTKPDVFFKRLNMILDICMELQAYEKYKIFSNSTPTKDYQKIIRNMELTVDNFIDRAIEANYRKTATLKTSRARNRSREEFVIALIAAFDCANTFWSGSYSQNRVYPHYTGPLFTEANYRRVQILFDDLD